MANNPENINLVILCGGRGRRLGRITDTIPKPMVQVNQRPFLDLLIAHASAQGVERFVLCAGYKGRIIADYYARRGNVTVVCEKEPLGTGGALKNARDFIAGNPFLVINGDSFCSLSLDKFLDFHAGRKAVASLVVRPQQVSEEVGSVVLGQDNKVVSFREKDTGSGPGYVNAGIYCFDKSIFSLMPDEAKFSLEYDFFPALAGKEFYGFIATEDFMDIGTPQSYRYAKNKLEI